MSSIKSRACVLLLSLIAGSAHALMPPHVTESFPRNGGILSSDTVLLRGYSLSYANWPAMTIVDLGTKAKVAATHKVSCKLESRCKGSQAPGCQQQRCEAYVKLASISVGHRYELRLGRTALQFTASPIVVTLGRVFAAPTGRVCYDYRLVLRNRGNASCRVQRVDIWLRKRRMGYVPKKPLVVGPGTTRDFEQRVCTGGSGGLVSRDPVSANVLCQPPAFNK